MLHLPGTAGQPLRRGGYICRSCSSKLAKRFESTRPWLVQPLTQSLFASPRRNQTKGTDTSETGQLSSNSEGGNVSSVEGNDIHVAKHLGMDESQHHGEDFRIDGPYTLSQCMAPPAVRSASQLPPNLPVSRIFKHRAPRIRTVQFREKMQVTDSHDEQIDRQIDQTFAPRPEITLKRPATRTQPVIPKHDYLPGLSLNERQSSARLTDSKPSSGSNIRQSRSNLRMFSTSLRTSRASTARAYKTSISIVPVRSTPKANGMSPIRTKLKHFQKALDNTTDDKKVALRAAFAKFSIGPNANSVNVSEQEDADNDFENATYDGDEEQGQIHRKQLEPGDLVEIPVRDQVCLGVITSVPPKSKTNPTQQIQCIGGTGLWTQKDKGRSNFPRFVVKGFVEASALEPIKPYLPETNLPPGMLELWDLTDWTVPPDIAKPIVEKIKAFQKEADNIYRRQASKIDKSFEILSDPEKSVDMTLEEMTKKVLNIKDRAAVTSEELYAVHKACSLHGVGFLMTKFHWASQTFEILSKRDAKLIEQIRQWVREHSEREVELANEPTIERTPSVIDRFVEEVRPVILESRKNRSQLPSGHLGPSIRPGKDPESRSESYFIESDNTISSNSALILRFLMLWNARLMVGKEDGILSALGPVIIKAIDVYHTDAALGNTIGRGILGECGIIAPWARTQDLIGKYSDPLHGDHADNLQLVAGIKEESENGKLAIDSMKALRHDWGEMPVYCIDSAGTEVVDDGIALESTSDPDVFWIHVHVANPTAYISNETKTAAFAQNQVSTVYLPDRANQMIPDDGILNRFSLHAGAPVLTFSTKLSLDGRILDQAIRNGIIHNVVYVTPERVRQYTGMSASLVGATYQYTVGQPSTNSQYETMDAGEELSAKDIKILRKTHELANAWWNRKDGLLNRQWLYGASRPEPTARVSNIKFEAADFSNFRHFVGDPTIRIQGQVWEPHSACDITANPKERDIVVICMILAGYTAAKWCGERGVPALFRGLTYETDTDLNMLAQRPKHKSSSLGADLEGYLERQSYVFEIRPSTSTKPMHHGMLGLKGYLQVTSPMRRYVDMITHWQIEAALREEAKLGRPLKEHDGLRFPWSPDALMQYSETMLRSLVRNSKRVHDLSMHWWHQFMVRGLFLGGCPDLPELFTMYIIEIRSNKISGHIQELGKTIPIYQQDFVALFGEKVTIGEVWKVKVDKERLGYQNLAWLPVERIA